MSDPTGGGRHRANSQRRLAAMKQANAEVKEVNQQLSTAREIYGPKHPTIKKLQADSVTAVEKRRQAIKDYQGR